jgi:hypothetical protein
MVLNFVAILFTEKIGKLTTFERCILRIPRKTFVRENCGLFVRRSVVNLLRRSEVFWTGFSNIITSNKLI